MTRVRAAGGWRGHGWPCVGSSRFAVAADSGHAINLQLAWQPDCPAGRVQCGFLRNLHSFCFVPAVHERPSGAIRMPIFRAPGWG